MPVTVPTVVEPVSDFDKLVLNAQGSKARYARKEKGKRAHFRDSIPPLKPLAPLIPTDLLKALFGGEKDQWLVDLTPQDGEKEEADEEEVALDDASPTVPTFDQSRSIRSPPPAYNRNSTHSQDTASPVTNSPGPPSYGGPAKPTREDSEPASPSLVMPGGWLAPPGLHSSRPKSTLSGNASPLTVQSMWEDDSDDEAESCPMPNFPVRAGANKAKAKPVINHISYDDFEMWNDEPTLVFVVRRSGCPMCRAQALLISHSRSFLKRLGYNTLAVFNTQNMDNSSFQKNFWGGSTYVDESLSFHKAVGEGEVRKANPLKESFTPAFAKRIWKAMGQHRIAPGFSNKTAGPVLGGMILFLPGDNGIAFSQQEDSLGDFGHFEELLRMAYKYSPYKDRVHEEDLEAAIAAHERRVNGRMPKLTFPRGPLSRMLWGS